MWCNQIFSLMALVDASTQTYVIKNIIVADNYTIANRIARAQYGADAIAMDTTRYPVSIGDTCVANVFYSNENGEEIPANPTEAESIKSLQNTVNQMTEVETELLYELSLMQLGLTE